MALVAALGYTLGHRAYGYHALGEVAVWLTFGLLGIGGHFYLQAQVWDAAVLLPACGSGLLAAALAAFICLPSALPHLARVRRAANCAAAGRELIPAVRLHTLANLGLSAGLLWTA